MSRSRAWLGATAALLAVALVVLLWQAGVSPFASASPAAGPAAAAAAAAAPTTAAPGDAGAGGHGDRTGDAEREQERVAAGAPQVVAGFTVEVLQADTRAPAADADVFALAEEYAPQLPDLQQPGYRGTDDARATQRARTDAQGRCRLAVPAGQRGRLWARHGERYGERTVRWLDFAPGSVVQLLLEPDPELRVLVVDAGATPCADVPVALGLQFDRHGQPIDFRVLAGRTDRDGALRLRHLAQFFDRSVLAGHGELRALVCLAEPGLDTVAQPFVWGAPPQHPLVLTLPPCGSLRVTLPPELAAVSFRVQMKQLQPAQRVFNFQAASFAGELAVVFPRVAVGATFVAQAQVGSLILDSEPGGPTQAGQCAELRLRAAEDALLLRGRALLGGEPAAGRRLQFELLGDGLVIEVQGRTHRARRHGGTLTTGADGTFVVPLARRWAGTVVDDLTLASLDRPALQPERARHPAFALPEGGSMDLGDLALQPLQPIVRGRVRVETGPPRDLWCRCTCVDRDGRDVPRTGFECAVDRERFAVFADAAVARGAVTAHAEGALPRTVGFAAGDPPLEIVLQQSGELLVTVRTPGPWPATAVEATLQPCGGGDAQPLLPHADEDGTHLRLWRDDLPPGRYDLHVGLRAQPATVVVVAGLDVPAGGRCADPRLAELQLPGRRVRVACVDATSGAPVLELGRMLLDRPAAGRWHGIDIQRAPAVLVVQGAPEALVLMPGYRPQLATLDRDEVQVPLRTNAAPLTVRLAQPELPLPEGTALRLAATPELDADEARTFDTPATAGRVGDVLGRAAQDAALVPGEPLRLRLCGGRWTLRLTASRGAQREVVAIEPAALALDGGREQTLQVDGAEWQRVARALASPR